MKKLFLLAAVAFFACHKSEIAPASEPRVKDTAMIIYRTYKMNVDSAKVYADGVLLSDSCSGYNLKVKIGAMITFKVYGQAIDSTSDFAIWKNENALPAQSIQFYKPSGGSISGSYLITAKKPD